MTNTAVTTAPKPGHDTAVLLHSTAETPPPTPPPPRLRARGEPRPAVLHRRVPALPPDREDPTWELDPVTQNERNDEIWQRRLDACSPPALPGRSTRAATPRSSKETRCRQCRRVEERSRLDVTLESRCDRPSHRSVELADLSTTCPAHMDNDYVEEPSTSSLPRRLSELASPETENKVVRECLTRTPVKPGTSRKDDSWTCHRSTPSSTRVSDLGPDIVGKVEVRTQKEDRKTVVSSSGVMCRRCGGCRCASCRRSDEMVEVCQCTGVRHAASEAQAGGNQCPDGRCRRAFRTLLGNCVACLCACSSVSDCRRRCTGAPRACRCRTYDSL